MPSRLFWIADLIVGFGLPVCLHALRRRDRVLPRLFWLGVALGLTWELPIFLSAAFAAAPILRFVRDPPVHPLVLAVVHALWDGGLFLAGIALLRLVFGRAALRRPRARELLLLLLWGQASAVAIETASATSGGWVYADPHRCNAVLFEVGGHPVTALPQAIWLLAPIVYYPLATRIVRRSAALGSQ